MQSVGRDRKVGERDFRAAWAQRAGVAGRLLRGPSRGPGTSQGLGGHGDIPNRRRFDTLTQCAS